MTRDIVSSVFVSFLSPALSHRGCSIAGVAVAMVLLAATAAVAVNIDFEA